MWLSVLRITGFIWMNTLMLEIVVEKFYDEGINNYKILLTRNFLMKILVWDWIFSISIEWGLYSGRILSATKPFHQISVSCISNIRERAYSSRLLFKTVQE